MSSGIYFIVCLANEGAYVGSSSNVKQRLCYHFSTLRLGTHDNSRMQRTFNKYGGETFIAGLLELVPTKDLLAREQEWLNAKVASLNIAKVVTAPMTGLKHSAETRLQWSKTRKGRKQSATHLANRIAALKGRTLSESHRQNLSRALVGRKLSPQHVERISASHKGNPKICGANHPMFGKKHRADSRAKISASLRKSHQLRREAKYEHK